MPFLAKTFNKTFFTQKFVGFSLSLDFPQSDSNQNRTYCHYWGEATRIGLNSYEISMVIESHLDGEVRSVRQKLEMPPLTRDQAFEVLSFMEERFLKDDAIIDIVMPEKNKRRSYYKSAKLT